MEFIMMRDRVVPCLSGHSIEFKKGVSTYVVPQAHNDVIAAGAVPTSEMPDDAAPSAPAAPVGDERNAKIQAAIETLTLKADREDWTAAGSPHAAALSNVCGFAVGAKERDEAWLRAQQNAGKDD